LECRQQQPLLTWHLQLQVDAEMPLFTVVGYDHRPHSMALRDSVRPEHREYWYKSDDDTKYSGTQLDPKGNHKGSLMIFEAEYPEHIRAWYEEEPFHKRGVYKDFHIIICSGLHLI
jgi:uncharacterized protein YciI